MRRRVHSREFKLEVARQVTSGEKRPAQVCREHNLSNSVLDRWRKEYEQRGEAARERKGTDRTRSLRAQGGRIGALLWAIGLGEHRVKKSLTPGRIQERHAVITQVHQDLPERSINRLCELLQVSRSWYYEKQRRLEADVELRDAIERIILDFPGYGYRRVTHALKRAGWNVNHKRVLRIMREESLLCQLKRHFVHTTDSQHPYQVYPNLIKGMVIEAPDMVWVADLTYIRLPSTFVY
jgi:hypothetical protein